MASGIPDVEGNIEGILITLRRSGLYFVLFSSSFSVGAVLAKARAHNHRWLPLRGCSSLTLRNGEIGGYGSAASITLF
jgi:hypothetical protein